MEKRNQIFFEKIMDKEKVSDGKEINYEDI